MHLDLCSRLRPHNPNQEEKTVVISVVPTFVEHKALYQINHDNKASRYVYIFSDSTAPDSSSFF